MIDEIIEHALRLATGDKKSCGDDSKLCLQYNGLILALTVLTMGHTKAQLKEVIETNNVETMIYGTDIPSEFKLLISEAAGLDLFGVREKVVEYLAMSTVDYLDRFTFSDIREFGWSIQEAQSLYTAALDKI